MSESLTSKPPPSAVGMPLAKRPPYLSLNDGRATQKRGLRVRSLQLHEELEFHIPSFGVRKCMVY